MPSLQIALICVFLFLTQLPAIGQTIPLEKDLKLTCIGKTVTGWSGKGPTLTERKEFLIRDLTFLMNGESYPCELARLPTRLSCKDNSSKPLFGRQPVVIASLEVNLETGDAEYLFLIPRATEAETVAERFNGTCKAR